MNKLFLILGDLLAIAVITVIGFASHGETDTSFLPRMAATFVPMAVSWFLLAPRSVCSMRNVSEARGNFGVPRGALSSRRSWPSSCADCG